MSVSNLQRIEEQRRQRSEFCGSQRTTLTNTAGDYRQFTYDPIGQLRTAIGKESVGATNRLHEQFSYAYDAAGNLNYRTNNALIQTFNVNSLNALTTVNRTGTLTVAGTTTREATGVTVNSLAARLYADYTFSRTGFTLADGNNTFTAIATDALGRSDTHAINVNLPATASLLYDLNGNLRTNGTRVFDYDDENQLIRITESNAWKSEFVYDGKMRCRIEKDYTWQSGAWVQTNEVRLVYDGDVPIQHRDINNLPMLTLTRGRDLSGSFQGAGGIGGILAMTENPSTLHSQPSTPPHDYFHCDGNGNVTMLIGTNQIASAKYVYDPFGKTLSISGPKAFANRYRFSSKPAHLSGLIYYLYRFYDPDLQRWINTDPLLELGSSLAKHRHPANIQFSMFFSEPNLYRALANDPIGVVDPDGEICLPCVVIVIAGIISSGCSKKEPPPPDPYGCWASSLTQPFKGPLKPGKAVACLLVRDLL